MKNNRRDAIGLARLLRAGELTSVWVPDSGHEAMRDLAFHVVGHQPPQNLLGQILHEVASAALQQRVQKWHRVELEIDGVAVRVGRDADAGAIAAVISALRAGS